MSKWIKIHDPTTCCLPESHFKSNSISKLKRKGLRKIYHANVNQIKARVAILLSEKLDFSTRKITRDREGHNRMTKGSTHQKDIATLNVNGPRDRAEKYVK